MSGKYYMSAFLEDIFKLDLNSNEISLGSVECVKGNLKPFFFFFSDAGNFSPSPMLPA